MAFMDLCVVVDWLVEQSSALGIDWSLELAGESAGTIGGGKEDDRLAATIVMMGEQVGASFDDEDDQLAEVIDRAHRGRTQRP